MKKLKIFLYKLLGITPFDSYNSNLSRIDANRAVAYISTNNIKDIMLCYNSALGENKHTITLSKIYSRFTGKGRLYHVVIEGYAGSQLFSGIVDLSRIGVSFQGSVSSLATILQIQSPRKSKLRKFSASYL